MTSQPIVTAVLVTHCSAALIADALRALPNMPVILVDNASTDDTVQRAEQALPSLQVIQNTSNVGFGTANNQALAQVTTPYALLINPDATIDADALAQLIKAAKTYPDAAILAPVLQDAKGKPHPWYPRHIFSSYHAAPLLAPMVPQIAAAIRSRWLLRDVVRGIEQTGEGDLCVEWSPASVWLVDVAHMRALGGFDENLFLFYEDDDLCLRARVAGFSCIRVASAKALHRGGQSSTIAGVRFRQQHMAWSALYLEQKYYGAAHARMIGFARWRYYLLQTLRAAILCRRAQYLESLGRLQGVTSFLKRQRAPVFPPR